MTDGRQKYGFIHTRLILAYYCTYINLFTAHVIFSKNWEEFLVLGWHLFLFFPSNYSTQYSRYLLSHISQYKKYCMIYYLMSRSIIRHTVKYFHLLSDCHDQLRHTSFLSSFWCKIWSMSNYGALPIFSFGQIISWHALIN